MARCDFAGGIENVRGTLSKLSYREDGKLITKRVVAQVTPSGKQRIFIREYAQRSSPLTDKERATRNKFAQVSLTLAKMPEEEKKAYAQAWKKNGYKYNGKKYNTLRGYIVARVYKNDVISSQTGKRSLKGR